jgi:hypothetical protein
VVIQTFKEYLNDFLQLFLDSFSVYGNKNNHTNQLMNFMENYQLNGIGFNLEKCALCEI